MSTGWKHILPKLAGLAILLGVAFLSWKRLAAREREPGIASGNGRIEATEIDIAAKLPGRIRELRVREGDFVTAGQPLAVMDTATLEAELHQAEAQCRQAENGVATASSRLEERRSERLALIALVQQREAELENARRRAARSAELAAKAAISQQQADDDRTAVRTADMAAASMKAQVAVAEAAIATGQAQVAEAKAAVVAAQATAERIQADLRDSTLASPRDGRIQYRIAQAGEVVGAGGKVLNLLDLGDVYMTFFLPTDDAGKIAIGSEVRIVLDAAPQYVFPAQVSFVADVAQFTPKTVETASERAKLMFRIRAQLPPELLKKHVAQVKTGLPGMAYVRTDPSLPWPARLQVRLPPEP